MAGESPDRSEQRKSSGETARGERDPRDAVRDRAGSSGADQPTAVFRLPEEPERRAGGETPAPGTETGSVEKDRRLRSAVAAWVASADDEPGESAGDADGAGDVGEADVAEETAVLPAPVPVKAEEKPDAKAEPKPKPGTDSDADAKPGTDAKPEPDAKADTDRNPEPDAKSKPDTDTDPKPVEKPKPKPDTAPKPDAGTDAKPKAGTDAKPKADTDAKPKPGTGTAPKPDTTPAPRPKPAPAEAAPKPPSARNGSSDDDSPTTALKVPPAPRSEASPASPVPAAAAERPSVFVPLRGDDDVRTPSWGKDKGTTKSEPKTKGEPEPESVADDDPTTATPVPAALAENERTRQQPLPPQPPLDLLAELTNTPPTPVRSAMRRVRIWTPLVFLLLIVFAVAQVLRPLPAPSLALTGDPVYTFGGDKLDLPFPDDGQGAVMVEGIGTVGVYGAQKPAPIASVAKTMTAYVILKEHPLTGKQAGEKIAIDKRTDEGYEKGLANFESVVDVKEGTEYTQRQMLELLMIPSANNIARLLARWDAGSEKAFIKKMNDAAADLGMKDTVYTDPSGFTQTTLSTPQDQLKLAEAVMQFDVFREIVDTTMLNMHGIDGTIYNNADAALLEPGVNGVKTGSSTPAGGNLLWSASAEVDGRIYRILGMTMGVQKASKLEKKKKLAIEHSIRVIKAAQQGLTTTTVIKKGQVVGELDNGLGGTVPVVATKDLKAAGWGGHRVEVAIDDLGETLPHAASAGEVVGEISVGSGSAKTTAPVALQQDVSEPGFGEKLTRVG
ncbi:D-alanyl-D-alanine carboxypeptidase [Streptomyces katsurahamanus]|uniref:D-alanyl-D-alanine carboxypeptidase n=1 Tax=Streptomyces katsurahamanus TaxID=2577098 RepID=A0ABW9NMX1_9ACTN|nr:D-alanyl-D-alanine carboxypeptidase [Streptomyces katsurahamanus]